MPRQRERASRRIENRMLLRLPRGPREPPTASCPYPSEICSPRWHRAATRARAKMRSRRALSQTRSTTPRLVGTTRAPMAPIPRRPHHRSEHAQQGPAPSVVAGLVRKRPRTECWKLRAPPACPRPRSGGDEWHRCSHWCGCYTACDDCSGDRSPTRGRTRSDRPAAAQHVQSMDCSARRPPPSQRRRRSARPAARDARRPAWNGRARRPLPSRARKTPARPAARDARLASNSHSQTHQGHRHDAGLMLLAVAMRSGHGGAQPRQWPADPLRLGEA